MKAIRRVFSALDRMPFLLLLGSLILVRIAYVLAIGGLTNPNPFEDYYDDMAWSLVKGDGLRVDGNLEASLVRYPLYPILLAGCYKLFGSGAAFVILQTVLDAVLLLVLYRLGQNFFNEQIARLGIVLAAFYPFTALYILRCLPETLFTLLLATVFLFLCQAQRDEKVRSFLLAGLFLGLATLCKSVAFYFGLIVPLLAFLPRFRSWRFVSLHLLVPLATLLTLLPWGARNYRETGHFTMLGTAGAYSLYIGNNLANDGRDRDEIGEEHRAIFKAHMLQITGGKSPTSLEAGVPLKAAMWQEFSAHPGASVGLIFRKAIRFWASVYGPQNRHFQTVVIVAQSAILLLAVPGIWLALRRFPVWPVVLGVVFMNGIHALVLATFRYSIPIMPEMLMFAAVPLRLMMRDQDVS